MFPGKRQHFLQVSGLSNKATIALLSQEDAKAHTEKWALMDNQDADFDGRRNFGPSRRVCHNNGHR
jgi:hypothetical protein